MRTGTPLQKAADLLLERSASPDSPDLVSFLRHRRASGMSYESIARELDRATEGGIVVSTKTVRRWFEDLLPDLEDVAS